jgi:hypothetical protein
MIGVRAAMSQQLGVFRLGLLENRNLGICVSPESEEVLIGSLCFGLVFFGWRFDIWKFPAEFGESQVAKS